MLPFPFVPRLRCRCRALDADPGLPPARWVHAWGSRSPRCRRGGPRRSRAGGLRHAASQARWVCGRSRGAGVVVRHGAARGEQSSAGTGSCGCAGARVVDVRAAVAGAGARARGGVGCRRAVCGGVERAGARGVSARGARGGDGAGDCRDARDRARHDVLAYPSRAAAVRAGDDGGGGDFGFDGCVGGGELRRGAGR